MIRSLVLDMAAANRILLSGAIADDWIGRFDASELIPGVDAVSISNVSYLVSESATPESPLIVISGNGSQFFPELPLQHRAECFLRMLRVGLTKQQPQIKIPLDWRVFHVGSLISFQTNRLGTQIKYRACAEFDPEGTEHVYFYQIATESNEQLSRDKYSRELFEESVLGYEAALLSRPKPGDIDQPGHTTITFTKAFDELDVSQGLSFRAWLDGRLTREQLAFFNAPFSGPLRLRGAAGTGKTLALALRFLKETYSALEATGTVRAAFLTHGQETASHVRSYLTAMDEKGLLFMPPRGSEIAVTTLHSLANDFINYDADRIQPISLDGAEGRRMQFELVSALLQSTALRSQGIYRDEFKKHVLADPETDEFKAVCCDIMDEFSSVLEAFSVRDVDEIAQRYMKHVGSARSVAQSQDEKSFVLAMYRAFRDELASMDVVSLDQFTSDFLGYLHSFRWNQVRTRKGFDFVFADELHPFNRQERQVLGYLSREARGPKKVAVAYDPRQSPRNSFFPEDRTDRDAIWKEANLYDGAQQFQLNDVFRYTPQILSLLRYLNQFFPGDDLAEEWGLSFGVSKVSSGPIPDALNYPNIHALGPAAAILARDIDKRLRRGERVAVLCLDPGRFDSYRKAGVFQQNFIAVSARDEVDELKRYASRCILSMPEFVAGLQFDHVIIADASAGTVVRLGSGVAGLQRFISAVYLGASRAKKGLTFVADLGDGGFAMPIREAIKAGLIRETPS